MRNTTSNPNKRKIGRRADASVPRASRLHLRLSRDHALRQLAAWLERHIRTVGDRLFREDDATACQQGWQVKKQHGGLSREYRDPRFDGLIRCPQCGGSGADEHDSPCRRCSATGRITVDQRSTPETR